MKAKAEGRKEGREFVSRGKKLGRKVAIKKLQEKQSKAYQDEKDSLEEGWKGKLTSNEKILRK